MPANRSRAMLVVVLALAALAGCKQFSFFSTLGDRLHDNPLSISPAAVTVPLNGTFTFNATGGQPPYSYSVRSGTGTIDAGTGLYTAPATACTETVRVTDNAGGHSDATVYVTDSGGPLAISPPSVTMGLGGSLTFVASGGTGPYSFSLVATGSGSPTINGSTGAYTAGTSTGTDTVRVQDALAATADATVTVTEAVTNVDYTVSATNFPATAAGGSPIPGGYDFTIENAGPAGGSKAVTWWVYLSDDGVLGSGDSLLSSGSTTFLPSLGTVAIPLTGSLPVSSGAKRLFVMVSAADDLIVGNNTSAGIALTLTLPDYTGMVVHNTGTEAGAAFTATLTINNAVAVPGTQDIAWGVYASLGNSTIDAGDKLVASGTITGGLPSLGSTGPMTVGNTWPSTPGNYFLVAEVQAADDGNLVNNRFNTGVTVDPPKVDYLVQNVQYTGGAVNPGALFTGSFEYVNQGADKGIQPVYWTVYASLNTTLDASDTWVSSDAADPLDGGGAASVVAFSGSWPLDYGNYYLLVTVSELEDQDGSNNTASSTVTTAIGLFTGPLAENNHEPNNDYVLLKDAYDLGITLQPGMSIYLEGTMSKPPADDPDDVLLVKAGANMTITASMRWTGSHSIQLYIWTAPGTYVKAVGVTADSLAVGWAATAGTSYWIDVTNGPPTEDLGAYTLIITAN